MNTTIIQIEEVIQEMKQGFSKPFLCRSDNGDEYIVKGMVSTRKSQISEWICGHLAKLIGLPIADFSLVEIPYELWEELPFPLNEIGYGIAFGSKKVSGVNWVEKFNAESIPESLQCKVIAFDLWIKNMDRCVENPNLLYQAEQQKLIIIDHNNAFDQSFDIDLFLESHIFRDVFSLFDDMVNRAKMEESFNEALMHFEEIYNSLPKAWHWGNQEEDIPVNYDFQFVRNTLERLNITGELWGMK